jgi:L,D-transpeptidase-like protein
MRRLLILLYLCFLPVPSHAAEIDPDRMIRPELLGEAIQAMSRHSDRTNPSRLVIVDYGLHSAQKRLFVVNLETGLVKAYRATHGRGSDKDHDGFLDKFSDVPGSGASPRGAYLTAEEYYGKHGRSLRLDGLDPSNANARRRAIVVHSAAYAEPSLIKRQGKLGRSNGCIAFSRHDLKTFLRDVPRGTLIYVSR